MNESNPVALAARPAARGRRRWPWLAAGAILTAAGLLLGSLGVVTTVAAVAPGPATETAHERQTYPRPAARVELSMATGQARVRGHDSAQVEVERELTWTGARPTVDEQWVGDTLRVDTDCPHWFLRWVSDDCAIEYAAAVPHETAAEVRTTTAPIEVRDLHRELALHSTIGAITVEGAGGPLSAHASTGNITGSDLRSGQAEAETTTGGIDLQFAEPPERIRATATTGVVTIEVPRDDAYRVDVQTTTGSQQVDVAQDPDAERIIEVGTTTGEVHIRYRS